MIYQVHLAWDEHFDESAGFVYVGSKREAHKVGRKHLKNRLVSWDGSERGANAYEIYDVLETPKTKWEVMCLLNQCGRHPLGGGLG